jgi:hypothetical protein
LKREIMLEKGNNVFKLQKAIVGWCFKKHNP